MVSGYHLVFIIDLRFGKFNLRSLKVVFSRILSQKKKKTKQNITTKSNVCEEKKMREIYMQF